MVKAGLFTTVQDLGRYGYLQHGIPFSGAMDSFSLAAANHLVGNNPNSAGLEITLIGPELQAETKTQIAVTGGTISPRINGEYAPTWQTLDVQEGDIISFGKMESGCRVYIALRGGINTPLILGSRSTYVRGGFGGIEGRQLRNGDSIEGFDTQLLEVHCELPEEFVPQFTNHFRVSTVLGPQSDMFTENGINAFFNSQYTVTLESDRMGYRLEGHAVEHVGKADIISDALLPGTVQVPRNGKPIVIMRDAQTTGGYPKIAVVTKPDTNMLGQAKPNDVIEFSNITITQAHRRVLDYLKLLDTIDNMLIRKE